MSIKVYFHGYICPWPNVVNVAEVNGNTVGECLDNFVKVYPSAEKGLFGENGKLSEEFALFLNRDIVSPEEIDEPIKDGQELHIIYLVGGG